MHAAETIASPGTTLSDQGRARLLSLPREPLFIADWDRTLMIHYEVDADALRREVPFELDTWNGRAFVSLAAFTLRGMRFRFGGPLGALLCKPVSTHAYLNVRTYVRHRDEDGIFFLAEWLSNPLCVKLGPALFGLPYRLGTLDYRHRHEAGRISGRVLSAGGEGRLEYSGTLPERGQLSPCGENTLDEFLMERYTAFTMRRGRPGFFRIWHPPWPQTPMDVHVLDQSLIETSWPFFKDARPAGANYSPGVRDVSMGWPHRLDAGTKTAAARCDRRAHGAFFEMP